MHEKGKDDGLTIDMAKTADGSWTMEGDKKLFFPSISRSKLTNWIAGALLTASAALPLKSTPAQASENRSKIEMDSERVFEKIQEFKVSEGEIWSYYTNELTQNGDGTLTLTFTGGGTYNPSLDFFTVTLFPNEDGMFDIGEPEEVAIYNTDKHESDLLHTEMDGVPVTVFTSARAGTSSYDFDIFVHEEGQSVPETPYYDIIGSSDTYLSLHSEPNEIIMTGGAGLTPQIFNLVTKDQRDLPYDKTSIKHFDYLSSVYEDDAGQQYLMGAADFSGNYDYHLTEFTWDEADQRWERLETIDSSSKDTWAFEVARNEDGTQGDYFVYVKGGGQDATFVLGWMPVAQPEDADGDGIPATEDCNDADPSILDAADGTCDGDSDGEIDATAGGSDCNDANAQVGSSKPENCTNGIDDDCDTKADAADPDCAAETDNDGDGYTEEEGDCNDSDASINPGATEITGDEVDQNCNGKETCYLDDDNDGYRPNSTSTKASNDTDCDDTDEAMNTDPTGDCNDNDGSINPGKSEITYNGKDDDCNSATLDDDLDRDGYPLAQDCNDANANINPGEAENCTNGIDDDCDTKTDTADPECAAPTDLDGDGFSVEEGDCNDSDPAINPDAVEIDGNTVDENCDGDYGLPSDSSGDIGVWSDNPEEIIVTDEGVYIYTPDFTVLVNADRDVIMETDQGGYTVVGSGAEGVFFQATGEDLSVTIKNPEEQSFDTTVTGDVVEAED